MNSLVLVFGLTLLISQAMSQLEVTTEVPIPQFWTGRDFSGRGVPVCQNGNLLIIVNLIFDYDEFDKFNKL